ncbi:hypothetical protein F2P56_013054 [Juglans regia]|uniref:Protein CHAPERONE-LIKE PROTEIN OF POR1, chloroplastic n=2 Tax=Juglans regia TaxID=51240 RepID=A0A833XPZ2_JUGRE|nr:hypothetical protein F2P56_013054 [Juglans regia]
MLIFSLHRQLPEGGVGPRKENTWRPRIRVSLCTVATPIMASLLLSKPSSLSTSFLPTKTFFHGNAKNRKTYCANFKGPRCAVDTPHEGNVQKFSRLRVWDPYKRLGVSRDASEEEIWGSRNFLLEQYAGHERSEESIEAAFEKILMASYQHRKKTKINLKSRLKKKVEESPPWVKNLLNFVELPPTDVIFRRLFLFAFMGGWSIMNSAEGGPAFQVAVSLAACIYFLNEKTKSLARAFIIGFGALVTGWICGSLLVPNIPSVILHPTWTLELLTSLVVYFFLFLSCTFLK